MTNRQAQITLEKVKDFFVVEDDQNTIPVVFFRFENSDLEQYQAAYRQIKNNFGKNTEIEISAETSPRISIIFRNKEDDRDFLNLTAPIPNNDFAKIEEYINNNIMIRIGFCTVINGEMKEGQIYKEPFPLFFSPDTSQPIFVDYKSEAALAISKQIQSNGNFYPFEHEEITAKNDSYRRFRVSSGKITHILFKDLRGVWKQEDDKIHISAENLQQIGKTLEKSYHL